jgi:hypothetical protein
MWLSPAERAVALALRVMLEEHLYFAILHNRWIEDAHWPLVRDAYLRPGARAAGEVPATPPDDPTVQQEVWSGVVVEE